MSWDGATAVSGIDRLDLQVVVTAAKQLETHCPPLLAVPASISIVGGSQVQMIDRSCAARVEYAAELLDSS